MNNNSEQLVFKGIIFDVYHWDQEMYDGTIKAFEKLRRKPSVNVIPVTKSKKIIVAKQSQPSHKDFIGCLGGRIDENETPEECGRRELLEETGMKADKMDLWFVYNPDSKVDWPIYNYIAKDCEKVKEQETESGEKIMLMEVDFDDFIKMTKRHDWRDSEIQIGIYKMQSNPDWKIKFKKLLGLI